jgi:ABC-type sugar transport system permease subunit
VAYAIFIPIIIYFALFTVYPVLFGTVLGFLDWRNIMKPPRWNGVGNFVRYFTSRHYRFAFFNQLYIGVLCVVSVLGTSLGVALLLNIPLRGRGFFRTIWYIPAVTSTVATSMIFGAIMDPNMGPIVFFLQKFGHQPINWWATRFWMIVWILIYNGWRSIGPSALLWLAGLQGIDRQLIDAAEVDGANKKQLFWHITLPGLRPIATYVLVVSFMGSVTILEPIMFISGGGPYGQTNVAMYQLVTDAFYDFNLGMAGANSLILSVIALIFAVVNYRLMMRKV